MGAAEKHRSQLYASSLEKLSSPVLVNLIGLRLRETRLLCSISVFDIGKTLCDLGIPVFGKFAQ